MKYLKLLENYYRLSYREDKQQSSNCFSTFSKGKQMKKKISFNTKKGLKFHLSIKI